MLEKAERYPEEIRNRVETHMFWQQYELHGWMEKYNIQHEAWGPLAQHRLKEVIEHPVVKEIALKYGKEPVQIALRHHVQRGIVVIPKSIHNDRMKQNLDIFDFKLQGQKAPAAKYYSLNSGNKLL